MSIFTEDFPYIDVQKSLRLGYRLPVKTLIPAYIKETKFFEDWYDAIDTVFDHSVYAKSHQLNHLRDMWLSNPAVEQKIIDSDKIIDLKDWSLPETSIAVRQLSLLGLQLGKSASLFNDENYVALCRFIGQYWFEKGTKTFMDFVNFCCGTQYNIVNTWTKDYEKFYAEGDEAIGTPIWEGGEWYPTTHIKFVSIDNLEADIQILAILFNEVANYNLVLQAIDQEYNFGDKPGEGGSGSESGTLPENPQGNGYICLGYNMQFHEAIEVGIREMLDINREILGMEGQRLGQLDHVPFAEEVQEYEPQEVFGFEGSDQNNFDNSSFGL